MNIDEGRRKEVELLRRIKIEKELRRAKKGVLNIQALTVRLCHDPNFRLVTNSKA
jgi:hypothetical protein